MDMLEYIDKHGRQEAEKSFGEDLVRSQAGDYGVKPETAVAPMETPVVAPSKKPGVVARLLGKKK